MIAPCTSFQSPSEKACPTPANIIQDIIALHDEVDSASRFGSFGGVVYDTAWLSMITKHEKGRPRPLFPECFEYILDSQQDDGVWGATGSPTDGIVNSLAALLALASRQRSNKTSNLTATQMPDSLEVRIEKGHSAILRLLQEWDVARSMHVGFEILIPSLLQQLSAFGLEFRFPGHSTLLQLNKQKLKKFDPALVYSPVVTTLLHSLEAFVGMVDFDQLRHHCSEQCGMFGSPASTAAYLINSSSWDHRAERYLEMVVSVAGAAVPSAYPTCLFEISWALSTLLTPGFLHERLTESESSTLSQLLQKTLDQQNGVVGFAPGILEDADDTARCLMALQCLGKSPSPDRMIEVFKTETHFRTYKLEGNASFTANCNVLLALLNCTQLDTYQDHIEKGLTFLLKLEESSSMSDKWNLSSQYARMLLMQVLLDLLGKYDSGHLQLLPNLMITRDVPGCVCRLLDQTLSAQDDDGSWGGSIEITAYSVITIGCCLSLPWGAEVRAKLNDRILQGREYIQAQYGRTTKIDHLWIEKVSYKSSLLFTVYTSTALNIDVIPKKDWSDVISKRFSLRAQSLRQTEHLISKLPLFQETRIPCLELVLVQANLVAERLRDSRNVLFDRDEIPMTADRYVDFIPMIWVVCNHKNAHALSADTVWEMILLSLFTFQIDEYMESMVSNISKAELHSLTNLLKQEIDRRYATTVVLGGTSSEEGHSNSSTNGHIDKAHSQICDDANVSGSEHSTAAVNESFEVLGRLIQHVSQHKSVLQAPLAVQHEILTELHNYFNGQIAHNLDNVMQAFSSNLDSNNTDTKGNVTSTQPLGTRSEYIKWVRSVASDDTSCPFAFVFFSCLVSDPQQHCFQGALPKYFSSSLCRHLATMCRQYNDYGSSARDAEEGTLNSLDFPEFTTGLSTSQPVDNVSIADTIHKNDLPKKGSSTSSFVPASAKRDLMALAEFERSCMHLARESLSRVVSPTSMQRLQVFIDVTDMFGQIYVQKDIASRVQKSQRMAE